MLVIFTKLPKELTFSYSRQNRLQLSISPFMASAGADIGGWTCPSAAAEKRQNEPLTICSCTADRKRSRNGAKPILGCRALGNQSKTSCPK